MKYEVYKSRDKKSAGQFRWRLKADNNKVIATSHESYFNEGDCRAAIALVQNSKDAPVVEV